MKIIINRQSIWVIGFMSGFVIGLFAAPAWEFSGMVTGSFGAVIGAVSAQFATYSTKGMMGSLLATIAGGVLFWLISRDNPPHVVTVCTLLIVASGVVGCGLGLVLGRCAVR